jgi:hypothetical protein
VAGLRRHRLNLEDLLACQARLSPWNTSYEAIIFSCGYSAKRLTLSIRSNHSSLPAQGHFSPALFVQMTRLAIFSSSTQYPRFSH